jgi:hypothetical protein
MAVTLFTEWITIPAVHFGTLVRTPTTRTTKKLYLKAFFAAQSIAAASPGGYIVPLLPLESLSTGRANKPAIIPAGFAVFFSQIERIESNHPIVSMRSAPTTMTDGILGGVTIAATVFIVRTDPEVVTLAPIIIAEHLMAIHTYRVKVINALLAHWSLGRVFQVAGD